MDADRNYRETEIVVQFIGEDIFYCPLRSSWEEAREAVAAGEWAEVLIPYHPDDESEPIYGFICYIENKPHDEIALAEMMMLKPHAKQMYDWFKDLG